MPCAAAKRGSAHRIPRLRREPESVYRRGRAVVPEIPSPAICGACRQPCQRPVGADGNDGGHAWALLDDAGWFGHGVAAGFNSDARRNVGLWRVERDGPRLCPSCVRSSERAAWRQHRVQREHGDGDGAAWRRAGHADAAVDAVARSGDGPSRLSLVVADWGNRKRDHAAGRPAASAQPVHGNGGGLCRAAGRAIIGICLSRLSRRTRAWPGHVHAPAVRSGQSGRTDFAPLA